MLFFQYHKSNAALDLMIGELRLKVDGMQKELQTQKYRLEEGERFSKQFHSDLSAAAQVLAHEVVVVNVQTTPPLPCRRCS